MADFFSSLRRRVVIPTNRVSLAMARQTPGVPRSFFDPAPRHLPTPPQETVSEDDEIFMSLEGPTIALLAGALILPTLVVPANKFRVGLSVWNATDARMVVSESPQPTTVFHGYVIPARTSAEIQGLYIFQPPVPQNALYLTGSIIPTVTGALWSVQVLKLRGSDYAAMRQSTRASGPLPPIGQTT